MKNPRTIQVAAKLEIALDRDHAVRVCLETDGAPRVVASLRDGSSLERFFYALGKNIEVEQNERRHIPWFG